MSESANAYDSHRYAMVNRWDPNHLKTLDRLLPLRPGDRVLEVGAGAGHLSRRLAERGVDVIGIDVNPQAADVEGTGLVVEMSAEDLKFDDAEFDAVVSFHAIEHIPPLDEAAREMARVLKPGGQALLVYPAEPIQGLFAVPTSVILHGTPFRAREIHCHWLSPGKVRAIFEPFGMIETHHEFNLFKSPQFVTRLVKTDLIP